MSNLDIVIDNEPNQLENALFDALEDYNEESEGEGKPKRRSMRAAINAYCKECIYDPCFKGGGTWREQTGACTVTKCPLWELRPVSNPRGRKYEQSVE